MVGQKTNSVSTYKVDGKTVQDMIGHADLGAAPVGKYGSTCMNWHFKGRCNLGKLCTRAADHRPTHEDDKARPLGRSTRLRLVAYDSSAPGV
mmetsp:Transcript_3244/g.7045  ORF Transcript_3244/g.7045 Transcript_3244/m.7045 type:complete len:92 (+) Transcript_3244:989-1264(+)